MTKGRNCQKVQVQYEMDFLERENVFTTELLAGFALPKSQSAFLYLCMVTQKYNVEFHSWHRKCARPKLSQGAL